MAVHDTIEQLLALPAEDREQIVEALIASLEADDPPPMDDAMQAEIERRLARADAGQTEWVTKAEAVASMRRAALGK